ncbi:MAG: nucleotide exchange factor GrpE [Parvularculaceae bacterium]
MSKEKDYPPNDGQGPEPVDEFENADAPEGSAGSASAAALAEEVAELNDRILRLAAELENTRRRAEREKQDAGRYAIGSFARDLLAVADNFERALTAAPTGESDESVASFITGVKMTERALLSALERHGVKKVDPKGEKFDPNLHQAVAQAPAAGIPAGHVAEVAQPGFVIGDRVLRAAMVVVSTGGDAAEAPSGAHVDTSA